MKKNIALLAGGDSGEYEISIKSAEGIKSQIDKTKYDVYSIHVKHNEWEYYSQDGMKVPVNKDDFTIRLGNKKITFDLVFIAIHGTPGEDGKMQGYFEMIGIPVTTCNSFTSSLTFNKYFCNNVVRSLGVRCATSMVSHYERPLDNDIIADKIGFPCFVKPNKGGSSVGITKVKSKEELPAAFKRGFFEDDEMLVEQFIKGREITCGVFRDNGKIRVLPLTEIVSKNDFFDFEAKYNPALAEEIVPAPLKLNIEIEIRQLSTFLYNELNCRGIVRFDYIVDADVIWFLEVNTVPGMTNESIVPKMVRELGISLTSFYSMLIEESLRKFHV